MSILALKKKINYVHRAQRDKLTHGAIESPKVPDPENQSIYFRMSKISIYWEKKASIYLRIANASTFKKSIYFKHETEHQPSHQVFLSKESLFEKRVPSLAQEI